MKKTKEVIGVLRKTLCIVIVLFCAFVVFSAEEIWAADRAELMRMWQRMSPDAQTEVLEKYTSGSSAKQIGPSEPLDRPVRIMRRPSGDEVTGKRAEEIGFNDRKPTTIPLERFGYDLFSDVPDSFAPVTDIPIPAEYIVGPGDAIVIQLYGKENKSYDLIVNRQGAIDMPGFGPVSVAGLSFFDMKQLLQKRVDEQKIGTKISVSLGRLRSIRIFILGEADRPGSYLVSSLSTLTNGLFVSGGVKTIGTLRNIQLKRKGKVIKTMDLYDLLLRGDTSNDSRLLPGDVIFIPPVGKTVSIKGEVLRPAVYELKNETSIDELISLAGGLKPTAFVEKVQVVRNDAKGHQVILDLPTSSALQRDFSALDGDVLSIESINFEVQDQVLLSGNVRRPGSLQWFPGMKMTDLIGAPSDLHPGSNLHYVIVKREGLQGGKLEVISVDLKKIFAEPISSENITLQMRDEVVVFKLEDKLDEKLKPLVEMIDAQHNNRSESPIVAIKGNVRSPGRYPYKINMTARDLLLMSHGAVSSFVKESYFNFGTLERTNATTKLREFLPVNYGDNADSLLLKPGDTLVVFSREDISYLNSAAVHEVLQGRISSALIRKSQKKGLLVSTKEEDSALDSKLVSNKEEKSADEPEEELVVGTCDGLAELISIVNSASSKRFSQLSLSMGRKGETQVRDVNECPEIFEQFPRLLPFVLEHAVAVRGEVRFPSLYPIFSELPVQSLIEIAGGPSVGVELDKVDLSSYAVAAGDSNTTSNIQTFDLTIEKNKTMKVRPGEVITVRSLQAEHADKPVTLQGEFRFPGQYYVRRDERLSEVISRAGGLTSQAYPYGTVFIRESVKKLEERASVRAAAELRNVLTRAISSGKGVNGAEYIGQMIERLQNQEPIGRMVVESDPTVLDIRPELDILLESGDRIFVPKRANVVNVSGEVLNSGTFLFKPGASSDEYLRLAGGETESSEINNTFVVLPNGEAQPLKISFWNYTTDKIPPGSTIIVPRDLTPFDFMGFTSQILAITRDMAITAASLNSIN